MAAVAVTQMIAPVSKLELHFSCIDLPNMDVLSLTDPQIRVYLKDRRTGTYEKLIGETEKVDNNLNPKFARPVIIDYYFEETQNLRIECIDVDAHTCDFIGNMNCTVAEIVGARGSELARVMIQDHHSEQKNLIGHRPICIVRADEIQAGVPSSEITFSFYANHLDKKDLLGKSDPVLEIHRVNDDGKQTLVYQSEYILKTLDPTWKPFTLTSHTLCLNDPKRDLILRVWDWNKNGKFDYIGETIVTLEKLQTEKSWNLINTQKQSKKKHYQNSGVLSLANITIKQLFSFMDYILGGMQFNLVVGIDYTASNGNPTTPSSLHFRGTAGNQYTQAIAAISSILLSYDADGMVPVWGFGGRLPTGVTSHCFAVTGDPARPEVPGIQGILNAYSASFNWVGLHGPTYFAPIIQQVAANAATLDLTMQDIQSYIILLILTDGEITDLSQTCDAIAKASKLPLSIIIVGVGTDDFAKMKVLDGDERRITDSNGIPAARDIVQFVPFKQFAAHPDALAAEVLAEIPAQVCEYMKLKGIKPNARKPAPILNAAQIVQATMVAAPVPAVQMAPPPQQQPQIPYQGMPPPQQQQPYAAVPPHQQAANAYQPQVQQPPQQQQYYNQPPQQQLQQMPPSNY